MSTILSSQEQILKAFCDFKILLMHPFHMKDLGPLNYFLGLEVHKLPQGLLIDQQKYILDLIHQARLQNTPPVDTASELNVKHSKEDGDPLSNPTAYRRLVGSPASHHHQAIHLSCSQYYKPVQASANQSSFCYSKANYTIS